MNLDGIVMYVSSSAEKGVVGSGTRLHFVQKGARVFARYSGGAIERGCLVGSMNDQALAFRYVQREASGELHAGRSLCEVQVRENGRIRIFENFRWSTREGAGTNVFDEVGG
jgi:hypothetical protein